MKPQIPQGKPYGMKPQIPQGKSYGMKLQIPQGNPHGMKPQIPQGKPYENISCIILPFNTRNLYFHLNKQCLLVI